MATVTVIFNSDKSQVIGYFGSPQDPEVWPNQGQIEDTDARYIAFVDPQPTADGIRNQYEAAAQRRLDDAARSWGYDNIVSAATYVGSAIAQWAAEGAAMRKFRDDTWSAAHQIDVSVTNGQMSAPTDEAAFLALLPPIPDRPTA